MINIPLVWTILFSALLMAGNGADTCESLEIDQNKSSVAKVIELCSKEVAASKKNAVAMYRLGLAYEKMGDYRSAYRWYMKSARLGYPKAYRELAMMVVFGQGVKRDENLAFRLYLRATRPDNEKYFYDEETHTRSYSAEELLKLHSRVSVGSLLEEAGRKNPDAYVHLGDAYLNGKYGAKKEKSKAFYWFLKGAKRKDAYATIQLTKLCLDGTGRAEECAQAFDWNRKLAEKGDAEAQYLTGVRFYKGQGVAKSDEEAVKWFEKSAEQKNKDAEYMLVMIYRVKKGPSAQAEPAL